MSFSINKKEVISCIITYNFFSDNIHSNIALTDIFKGAESALFLTAHTPDNSFLGFVVEQHLNSSDIKHINDIKRQNQSLVYGKVDNFWKVSFLYSYA